MKIWAWSQEITPIYHDVAPGASLVKCFRNHPCLYAIWEIIYPISSWSRIIEINHHPHLVIISYRTLVQVAIILIALLTPIRGNFWNVLTPGILAPVGLCAFPAVRQTSILLAHCLMRITLIFYFVINVYSNKWGPFCLFFLPSTTLYKKYPAASWGLALKSCPLV